MEKKKYFYLSGAIFFGALGFAIGSFFHFNFNFHFQAHDLFLSFRKIFPSFLWGLWGIISSTVMIGLFGGAGLGILLKNKKKMLLLMFIGAVSYFLQEIAMSIIFNSDDILTYYIVFAPLTGAAFSLIHSNWKTTRNFMIASTLTAFFIIFLARAISAYMDPSGNLVHINPSLSYQIRDFLKLLPYFGLILLGGILGYLNGKIELKQRQANLPN